ncbi:MAG TPA: DOMON-like domain-containing protein [Allosphingosinicella sp.]|uniref:DOMON-like domain-containing protein n=1 Tax=Allosphingosinicella sp. TaxID=2823234 RepID=UPI002ED97578
MLRQPLIPHPDAPHPDIGLTAEIARTGPRALRVQFQVTGAVQQIEYPQPAKQERMDELWRHTCFELFLAFGESDYREFNFSPSKQWAAYAFSGYRSGMARLDIPEPRIELSRDLRPEGLAAWVTLDPAVPTDVPWHIGLSAVIEDRRGRTSYWALAHPPGKPDFHHRDCFTLELAAAG